MKITKCLASLFLVILTVCFTGCFSMEQTEVENTIISELDLLKNLDSDTAQKYISYQELFPGATENEPLSDELKEVFSLFFQDFDYKILDIDVDKKQNTAVASVRLSTIDAHALAQDFAEARLKQEIQEASVSASTEKETNSDSLEERFLLLNKLLKENTYETVETSSAIYLQNTGKKEGIWTIERTHALENDLVGGLITYLSDPDILLPEDTLRVYLNTLKKMNAEEMSNYLGVESILSSSDETKNLIAAALAEQVQNTFDYKIQTCEADGYSAFVETEITTFDSDSILSSYQKELEKYLASPDAVIDGSQKRYETSYQLLLSSIKENKATKTVSVIFELINDGISWKLENSQNELGNAIFGTLSTTPVSKEEEPAATLEGITALIDVYSVEN